MRVVVVVTAKIKKYKADLIRISINAYYTIPLVKCGKVPITVS